MNKVKYQTVNIMEQVSVEEAIRVVGGHSYYQKRLTAALMLVWLGYSLYLEGIVFLLIDFTKDMDEEEGEQAKMMIETSFFVGQFIGALTLSWVSNNFGRKPNLVFSQILWIVSLGATLLTNGNEMVYSICIFFTGIAYGGGLLSVFILLSEFIDPESCNGYLNTLQTVWGVSIVIVATLFWINEDWKFSTVIFLLVLIAGLIVLYKVDESARFYTSVKHDYVAAHRVLDRVADANKSLHFQGTLQGESSAGSGTGSETTTSRKFGYFDLVKYGSIRNYSLV